MLILLFAIVRLWANNNQEFRAVWVITWEHINPDWSASKNEARVRRILDNVKAANMNAVLWQVRQSGTAYYKSSYEPWGYYADYHNYPGYDPLAYAIREAHKRGLELHAWFNVYHVSSTYRGTPADEHPEWICTNRDGNYMTAHRCISPGLDEARAYTIKVAMELVRKYDIDGLHLDFVRWNEYDEDDMINPPTPLEQVRELDGMLSPEKLNKLNKASGTKRYIYDKKHPYSGGVPSGFSSWDDWRRWGVTEFVRQLHDSIQAVKPWVRLSPAALGKYNWSGWNGYSIVFQDAALWFNRGFIDQLTPMHYHWTSAEGFYDMLQGDCPDCWSQWIQPGINAGRLYTVGPGSYMLDDYGVWDRHKDIVERCRDVNWTDGFQFFSYNSWEKHNYWQTAAQQFFTGKTKIRATKLIVNQTPPAPILALSKMDSMHYNVSITPKDSLNRNYWFAIYRSADSILNVNKDQIVNLHYGKAPFTYTDSYWGEHRIKGRYTYFATMLDRYWNESSISNSATGDSVPNVLDPPETPQYIRVVYADSNALEVFCDPVLGADEYVALISPNGNTFNDSVVSTTNQIIISGLTENQIYYFRVKAKNSSGSSALCKHLYAAVPSQTPHSVLVVNGFDRSTNTRYDYIKKYAGPLLNCGYAFSYAMNESVYQGKISLKPYKTVIWILGDESTADQTFNSVEQDSVEAFLKRGGNLLVSGSEIAWDLDHKGSSADKSFYHNYLKAGYVADAPDGIQSGYYSCLAIGGGLFDGLNGFSFDNGTHGTFDVDWPDAIKPLNGAVSVLKYKNAATSNIAAIAFEGVFPGGASKSHLVNMGVPFETIFPDSRRNELMSKIFDFFEGKISGMGKAALRPRALTLEQNYPNPFNPATQIDFSLPVGAKTTLTVYNILGQKVRVLVNRMLAAGEYHITFSAKSLASGMYVYELRSGKKILKRRMLLLK